MNWPAGHVHLFSWNLTLNPLSSILISPHFGHSALHPKQTVTGPRRQERLKIVNGLTFVNEMDGTSENQVEPLEEVVKI